MASTSSPTSTANPYGYQKASTLATRTLVSDQKPTETPASGSHDHNDTPDKPLLQRKHTDNYEKAMAAAGQAQPANATTGATPTGDTDRPGYDRQQSFSRMDYKRGVLEQTLAGSSASPHGYYSKPTQ